MNLVKFFIENWLNLAKFFQILSLFLFRKYTLTRGESIVCSLYSLLQLLDFDLPELTLAFLIMFLSTHLVYYFFSNEWLSNICRSAPQIIQVVTNYIMSSSGMNFLELISLPIEYDLIVVGILFTLLKDLKIPLKSCFFRWTHSFKCWVSLSMVKRTYGSFNILVHMITVNGV